MQQEKKLREQAEQFFEDAIRQIDDPERKEEVEGERETYICVWMLGYRAGEAEKEGTEHAESSWKRQYDNLMKEYIKLERGREEDAVAFAQWLATERWQPRINTEWARYETIYSDVSVKTTAELYNIFKKES